MATGDLIQFSTRTAGNVRGIELNARWFLGETATDTRPMRMPTARVVVAAAGTREADRTADRLLGDIDPTDYDSQPTQRRAIAALEAQANDRAATRQTSAVARATSVTEPRRASSATSSGTGNS